MINNITTGIWTLINLIPLTCILFLGVMMIKTLLKLIFKKRTEFKLSNLVSQFLWILIVLSILKITGIIGGNFGVSSPFDCYISYKLFEEGLNGATLLNICLFVPFGFLSVFTFRKLDRYWWFGILIGFAFSALIEFLQMFTGRFVQLDDIVMNTLGTFIGYEIGIRLMRLSKSWKKNLLKK